MGRNVSQDEQNSSCRSALDVYNTSFSRILNKATVTTKDVVKLHCLSEGASKVPKDNHWFHNLAPFH